VARAEALAEIVDAAMDFLPLVGDLALAVAGHSALESEVDLVLQPLAGCGQPRLLGLEARELPVEVVESRFCHGALIGREPAGLN
jgi:hypothetical protein